MTLVVFVLHLAGLICFALAAGNAPIPHVNMIGLGLFLFFLPSILGGV